MERARRDGDMYENDEKKKKKLRKEAHFMPRKE